MTIGINSSFNEEHYDEDIGPFSHWREDYEASLEICNRELEKKLKEADILLKDTLSILSISLYKKEVITYLCRRIKKYLKK